MMNIMKDMFLQNFCPQFIAVYMYTSHLLQRKRFEINRMEEELLEACLQGDMQRIKQLYTSLDASNGQDDKWHNGVPLLWAARCAKHQSAGP